MSFSLCLVQILMQRRRIPASVVEKNTKKMRTGLPVMSVSTGFTGNMVVRKVSKSGTISNLGIESFGVKIVK